MLLAVDDFYREVSTYYPGAIPETGYWCHPVAIVVKTPKEVSLQPERF